MPGAVRAPLGTRARHTARPVEPEQIMTKTKTTNRPSNEAIEPKTAPTTAEAKSKRLHGKAAPADKGSATATAAVAPTENLTETPTTQAIPAASSKPPRQTKAALLRVRLAESGGASLAALIEATGWQAHTLRAAMSGLRKEGLTLTRRREGEDTIYAIDPSGIAAGKTTDEGAEKETATEAPCEAKTEDIVTGAADAAEACHSDESKP